MIKNSNTILIICILVFIILVSGCIFQNGPGSSVNNTSGSGVLTVYCNADVAQALKNLSVAFETLNPGDSINVINGTNNASVIGMTNGQGAEGQMTVCCISRPPSNEEYVSAKDHGVDLQMTEIAIDSICIFVNPSNNLSGLNTSQLNDIFYTGLVDNWSQLENNDNNTINVYVPTNPDIVQQFAATIDGGNLPAIGKSAQDNTSLDVSNDMYGISYGLKQESGDNVKIVDVNGLSSRWGNYPLSYQIYMITNGTPGGLSLSFINYILSHSGQEVVHGSGLTALDPTV